MTHNYFLVNTLLSPEAIICHFHAKKKPHSKHGCCLRQQPEIDAFQIWIIGSWDIFPYITTCHYILFLCEDDDSVAPTPMMKSRRHLWFISCNYIMLRGLSLSENHIACLQMLNNYVNNIKNKHSSQTCDISGCISLNASMPHVFVT